MSLIEIIVGEDPIAEELPQKCAGAGHHVDTVLVEEILAAVQSRHGLESLPETPDIVIESWDVSAETNRELMTALDFFQPAASLIMTSALTASVTQCAAWTQDPGPVVGYGLISPIGPDPLIELEAAPQTNEEGIPRAKRVLEKLRLRSCIGC